MKNQILAVASLLFYSGITMAMPTVTDNTISWPDDGWYQVQVVNDDGVFEICQGGRSCEVAQGEYIVINHTTGDRFEEIFVASSMEPDGITVTGNIISWPDDGWYQVQDELTYTEICGGTRSCEVEPGSYVVTNHTSGERFGGISVSGSNEHSLIPTELFALPDFENVSLLSLEENNPLLPATVAVANAQPLTTMLKHFDEIPRGSGNFSGFCPDGGSILVTGRSNGGCTRCQTIYDAELNSCSIGSQQLSGKVVLLPLTGGRELIFESVSYTDSDGSMLTFIGNYQQLPSAVGDVQTTIHRWAGDWNAISGERTVAVSHYDSEQAIATVRIESDQYAEKILKFETSFSIAGTVTNGPPVAVETSIPLLATVDDVYYQTGVFVIQETLEDSLTLDFGTGDGETVMRSLQTALSTEQLISAWQGVAEFRFLVGSFEMSDY